jgi:peptidoglycan/LPS O-acetylase OafA/YrhL
LQGSQILAIVVFFLMNERFDRDSELLIDGLRGIAALLVMFTHSFDLAVAETYGWSYAENPEGWRWARASIGHGGFWVWCFFMISGLCIHRSIARSIEEGSFSWWRYAVARITRIYPLFLIGLALAGASWMLHEEFGNGYNPTPWRQLGASLLSLHIFTAPFPAFEPSWSLSCEMIYYAMWPTALLLSGGRVNRAAFAALIAVLMGVTGILVLWKVFHLMEHRASVDGVWTILVLFPVWICGAWMAGNWASVRLAVSRRKWVAAIVLCFVSEGLLVVLKFKQYPGWAVHLAGWSSIPGLMLLLTGAEHVRLSARPWAEPVCRWLGQMSYPCYILHMQLLLLLVHFMDQAAPEIVHHYPIAHAAIEFSVVLAVLIFVGPRLERFFMAWRSRVLASTRASVLKVA